MSSDAPVFAEEVSSSMLKELQSWWEIPAIAQYISLFREPFNLPEIEIEELEKGFIDDTINGPSEWLLNLVLAFLKSLMPGRINQENWYEFLKRHIRRKWPEFPYCEKKDPFPTEQELLFHELPLRSKVEIVYCCCLSRLDRNDIMDQMKNMDAEALRVQKLGMDDAGNTYWYFYGTRLYKEEFPDEKKTWDEEWKEQKRKSFQKKKRGRGRPRKQAVYDEGSDSETSHNDSRYGFMNVSDKSRWSVVCDTIEEWVTFAEKFKNSKSKSEKSLFTIIQENFLPTLNSIYEEKERKLQQKIKELMPTREKIVTRRETRRLRGEDVIYSPVNGYGSDEGYRTHVIKDRARRLQERNKRAIEAENGQGHKKARQDRCCSDNDSSFQMSDNNSTDLQSQMERILSNVKLHKDAWPFLYPVVEEDAPGYYEIIKDAIDLSTIEQKLRNGKYDSIGDLDADFKKMVSNCELYNGEYHAYSKMAQALRKMFRKEIAKLLDALQAAENECADSEESSDSQYQSSSNSSSPPHESPVSAKEHKPKSGHNRKRKAADALDLLAQASDRAIQENHVNRTSPQQKSPTPPETQPASYVPSTNNMPYQNASSTSSSITKPSLPVTSSNFVPVNNTPSEGAKKPKPVIIYTKAPENVTRASPSQNIVTSSYNINNTNSIPGTNTITTMQQSMPLVISGYNNSSLPNQMKTKPVASVMTMPNMSGPNRMPIMQQVLIPAGSQQIVQNNGQYFFTASPQNAVKMINKDQNVQIQSAIRPLNQTFGKVVPQMVNSAPFQLQIAKDGTMQNFQLQTLSPGNNQTFTQVAQSPQFLNIPYMLTNQNALSNSPQQSVINIQPYQLSPRQIQINGPGNG